MQPPADIKELVPNLAEHLIIVDRLLDGDAKRVRRISQEQHHVGKEALRGIEQRSRFLARPEPLTPKLDSGLGFCVSLDGSGVLWIPKAGSKRPGPPAETLAAGDSLIPSWIF